MKHDTLLYKQFGFQKCHPTDSHYTISFSNSRDILTRQIQTVDLSKVGDTIDDYRLLEARAIVWNGLKHIWQIAYSTFNLITLKRPSFRMWEIEIHRGMFWDYYCFNDLKLASNLSQFILFDDDTNMLYYRNMK